MESSKCFLSLRPFGPPPSSEGGLGFCSFATQLNPLSEGGLAFRSLKGPLGSPSGRAERAFQIVRAADTSPIHYSLFSIIYYLTPPWPPLTRIMSAQLTGGEIVPYFPETVSVSLAPSDEGAVNGVDWGREPGISIFTASVKWGSEISPSGPSGHLPHQREAWVFASSLRS